MPSFTSPDAGEVISKSSIVSGDYFVIPFSGFLANGDIKLSPLPKTTYTPLNQFEKPCANSYIPKLEVMMCYKYRTFRI
ncbi:MAG: hypothetical protein ABJE62_09250 [Balneola sp.]